MDTEHQRQLEVTNSALEVLEKLLLYLPDHAVFHPASYAKYILGWTQKEYGQIAACDHHLYNVAVNHFGYFKEKTKGYYYELTDVGREAKAKGGHIAYQQYLEDKKKKERERQERKDKTEQVDLLLKHWQVKTKWYPYLVSTLALAVSVFSYFKPDKKQVDLQQVQQTIQQLQAHDRLQDSLFRADTLLRKRNK